jgi:hypothetical protein
MRLIHEIGACARMALLSWVSLWMLMVPWFHVHPEVEHTHGTPGHVHRAVTHTLFSPPLECESHAQLHDDTYLSGTHQHFRFYGHHGHSFAHPEIGFALAASSATPPISKIFLSPSVLIEDLPSPAPIAISEHSSHRKVAPTLLFLATALPLRAPPALLS